MQRTEPIGKIFKPAKIVIPLHAPTALLDARDGSYQVEEAVPHPGVRPEVDDRVDAGMAECYEEEHGVDVSENMTKKDQDLQIHNV